MRAHAGPLLSISAGWTISVLTSTASALDARHATEATLVPHEDLLKAAELKRQAAAAKKALDQTIGSGPAGEKYKKSVRPQVREGAEERGEGNCNPRQRNLRSFHHHLHHQAKPTKSKRKNIGRR